MSLQHFPFAGKRTKLLADSRALASKLCRTHRLRFTATFLIAALAAPIVFVGQSQRTKADSMTPIAAPISASPEAFTVSGSRFQISSLLATGFESIAAISRSLVSTLGESRVKESEPGAVATGFLPRSIQAGTRPATTQHEDFCGHIRNTTGKAVSSAR